MVTATRTGKPYSVEVSNGCRFVRSDTRKDGKGGDAGMRPHELLESALAACICMPLDMAAEREQVTLPDATVEVVVDRLGSETVFNVSLRFAEALSASGQARVRDVVRASPVARTLGKPIRVNLAGFVTD
ncbi:peroxiredoxin [Burkholderia pyrrocinia]|uniref:Peroxiredoxin n=1 Tax=Burkholderia pyrrocinia TaxID=60550 RepID=A0A2Z5N5D1_BURPY|nr:OsmC family protein [Burkholderia pyrrocinia]AXF24753.1 peroxiredoxin [Burkholderia pyrrocinia]